MKMKLIIKLALAFSPLCLISILHASDTGYYQNFSTNAVNPSATQNQQAQQIYQAPADYYSQRNQKNTRQNNFAAQIIPVSNIKTGAHVVLGGTVVADKEIVMTAQISGRVEYIAGQEGDWFDEGQILAAINHDNILAQREQAIANLYRTEASLGNAKVNYTKEYWAPQAYRDYNNQKNKLYGPMPAPAAAMASAPAQGSGMGYFPTMFDRFMGMGGNAPAQAPSAAVAQPVAKQQVFNLEYPNTQLNPWIHRDLDMYSSENNINMAKSNIMAMRSRVNEIDTHLRDARSISPFEGVIVEKLVEVGDTVQRGQALIKYSDTRSLQLEVDVPARLVSSIEIGTLVPAKLDVGSTYIDVRVAQIFPTADKERHTVTVKFDLPEGAPGGPGMYAEVMVPDLNTPINSMPVIPSSAILHRGSLPAVFVLNSQNKAELRLVRLGDQVDNQYVAVLAGVLPGENIFVNPHPGMRSGWTPQKENNSNFK
ncbi:MAG: efflux RND transporter periplasmic adaptor subunit [Gammaproteobacteria bacterium]|nr:efflux RND transporter periplasmic adaptor subunit [Gammaproteobacteria bacterium]